jgi:hypothetical protein
MDSSRDLFNKKKSLWKERDGNVWSFFCPLCRANRKVPFRSRPGGFKQTFQIGVTAAFFTLVTWNWFDWKGIVSFVPLWAIFEAVYRTRTRAHLNCPHCGFDPYLYLVDIKKARREIEDHWRKKFAEKGIPFPEPDKPVPYGKSAPAASTGPQKILDSN